MSAICRPVAVVVAIGLSALSFAPTVFSQGAVYPPQKESPPKIEPNVVLVDDAVVETYWQRTLDLVNAPENRTLVSPGHCIRVGVVATGDGRDDYLKRTKLSFKVAFMDHTESHAAGDLSFFKKLKPSGGDFVARALASAGVKAPDTVLTMASLGVSGARWCVPAGARDGTARVDPTIEGPSGPRPLAPSEIRVATFAAERKKTFNDAQDFGEFVQTYYRQPNPGRLIPAARFMVAEQMRSPRQGQVEILAAFVSAALKSDPAAAKDVLSVIGSEEPIVRALVFLALRSAGYDIEPVLTGMTAEDREKVRSLPKLDDPFDLTPSEALFHHFDLLWSVFGATGQYEPVKAITSALAWRQDYEELGKLKTGPSHPSTLTPSIVRGVGYSAAGWSLRSFQQHDPLVADYIDYMLVSPEISPAIKTELRGLATNSAFDRPGKP
jgi:hypothetical protein